VIFQRSEDIEQGVFLVIKKWQFKKAGKVLKPCLFFYLST
jgi:hypothetical protein